MKEYKTLLISEGAIGTVLLGASRIPVKRIESELNAHAKQGWRLAFMITESRRLLFLWTRESVVITLERDRE